MSDVVDKVAQLEATEKELQAKSTELEFKKAEIQDFEGKKNALNAELERVQRDVAAARESRRSQDGTFQEKLRGENLDSAKSKFFTEFGYKPEDQQKFLESFKGFDSGSVNSDLIYRDMMKAHVAQNPEKYVEMERKFTAMSQNSEKFAEFASSGGFAGLGGVKTEVVGLDENDILAAQRIGLPLEKYKEYKVKYGW